MLSTTAHLEGGRANLAALADRQAAGVAERHARDGGPILPRHRRERRSGVVVSGELLGESFGRDDDVDVAKQGGHARQHGLDVDHRERRRSIARCERLRWRPECLRNPRAARVRWPRRPVRCRPAGSPASGSRSHRTVRSPVRASTSTIANRVGESTACCVALTSTPSLVRLASPSAPISSDPKRPTYRARHPSRAQQTIAEATCPPGSLANFSMPVLGVAAGKAVEDGEQVHAVLPQPDDVEGARAVGRAAENGIRTGGHPSTGGSDMPDYLLAGVRRWALADRAERRKGTVHFLPRSTLGAPALVIDRGRSDFSMPFINNSPADGNPNVGSNGFSSMGRRTNGRSRTSTRNVGVSPDGGGTCRSDGGCFRPARIRSIDTGNCESAVCA